MVWVAGMRQGEKMGVVPLMPGAELEGESRWALVRGSRKTDL